MLSDWTFVLQMSEDLKGGDKRANDRGLTYVLPCCLAFMCMRCVCAPTQKEADRQIISLQVGVFSTPDIQTTG